MLVGFPSDDLIWDATLTMADADADYPVTNAQDNDPANTCKSTDTSSTIGIALSGSATVAALMVANTNATSGSFASDSGAILTLTSFPALTPDGKLRNRWFDLRGLANITDDAFSLTLTKTGSAVLEFGRICLLTALQAPEVLWAGAGRSPEFTRTRPGQIEHTTRLGATPRRHSPVAPTRRMQLSSLDETTFTIFDQLEAESNGLGRGFLFIPDDDDTDAWFAQCAFEPFRYSWEQPEVIPMELTIHEISMGLSPART